MPKRLPSKTKKRVSSSPKKPSAGERLQKVLAAAGFGSRRQCEELILEGRVEVDRETVTELGTRVEPGEQEIFVDGEPVSIGKRVYYAVHKPTGVVSTARDPAGRPRVIDLLPPSAGRLFNVGRLDMSSEGLILLTNDGELANQLTHPSYGVEKTYHVQIAGHIEPEVLSKLRKGIHLSEAFARVKTVRIKSRRKTSTILEMILSEGRNREIRRVLARVGHKVQRLVRVAVGPVRLGEMPAGAYRLLTPDEVKALRRATRGNTTRSDEKDLPRKKKQPNRNRTSGGSDARSSATPHGRKKTVKKKQKSGNKKVAFKGKRKSKPAQEKSSRTPARKKLARKSKRKGRRG